jgi:hypothetical protein
LCGSTMTRPAINKIAMSRRVVLFIGALSFTLEIRI